MAQEEATLPQDARPKELWGVEVEVLEQQLLSDLQFRIEPPPHHTHT